MKSTVSASVNATKAASASDGLPRDVAERGEHGRVHDEIGDRVQVPAGQRHLPGRAGEGAVCVVEQRLQLQKQRGRDEVAAIEHERGEEAGRRIRQNDRRRRDPGTLEQRHERVRERSEDELENELATRSSRLGPCGRDRHRGRW